MKCGKKYKKLKHRLRIITNSNVHFWTSFCKVTDMLRKSIRSAHSLLFLMSVTVYARKKWQLSHFATFLSIITVVSGLCHLLLKEDYTIHSQLKISTTVVSKGDSSHTKGPNTFTKHPVSCNRFLIYPKTPKQLHFVYLLPIITCDLQTL